MYLLFEAPFFSITINVFPRQLIKLVMTPSTGSAVTLTAYLVLLLEAKRGEKCTRCSIVISKVAKLEIGLMTAILFSALHACYWTISVCTKVMLSTMHFWYHAERQSSQGARAKQASLFCL